MLRSSALYIVIVIALVIAILCSSLIVMGYYYRLQYQKNFRTELLQSNLNSGINILVASKDTSYINENIISLFSGDADSVSLKKVNWGMFDIGICKSFIQKDTLFKVFSIASLIDSVHWSALYLANSDRPVSVGGKTQIEGDAYLPKAGIQQAYVDGKSYEGNKDIVSGKIRNSERSLPALNENRLNLLNIMFHLKKGVVPGTSYSLTNSFLTPIKLIDLGKNSQMLKDVNLSGNIVITSDTTLTIDDSAILNNVMILAKSIVVKQGFKGTCQLFATDSISIERDCDFNYPSALGVFRFDDTKFSAPLKLIIGQSDNINGYLFTYDKNLTSTKAPYIKLDKDVKITGQIYSQGILELRDNVVVNGSISTTKFVYQSNYTHYENYIVNSIISSKALSSYFLVSSLLPAASSKQKVLQWIEGN